MLRQLGRGSRHSRFSFLHLFSSPSPVVPFSHLLHALLKQSVPNHQHVVRATATLILSSRSSACGERFQHRRLLEPDSLMMNNAATEGSLVASRLVLAYIWRAQASLSLHLPPFLSFSLPLSSLSLSLSLSLRVNICSVHSCALLGVRDGHRDRIATCGTNGLCRTKRIWSIALTVIKSRCLDK